MKEILNILGLLFLTSLTFALSNNTELQSLPRHTTEQIESEIWAENQSLQLHTRTNSRSSNTPTARRICSSHKHYKSYIHTLTTIIAVTKFSINRPYKEVRPYPKRLVYLLCNIRI